MEPCTFHQPDLNAGKHTAELTQACTEQGFFTLRDCGLDSHTRDAILRLTTDFFALPQERKDTLERSYDNPFGYYNKELTKNHRDQKEIFDFARPEGTASSPFGGKNQWPSNAQKFRETMEDYFRFCTKLSGDLIRIIAEAFELPARRIADAHVEHSSFARLNYYPIVDLRTELLGIHPHSDAGSLTVLLQDDNPGLEMQIGSQWQPVPPARDALVINMGDMLTVWSNGHIHAPIHRVRPSTHVPRISVPYFYNPGYDALINPLTHAEPRYRPFTWADFRRRRADGDFGDYGNEVQISDYRLP